MSTPTPTPSTGSRPDGSELASAVTSVERVTVVLLTFNCAHRLRPVVERLLTLGVPVVAVDNGSTDATVATLRSWPGITVVPLPRNIGAAARNEGARRAGTPYVAFCDDDGWYERDGLGVAVRLLDRHPSLALVNARILVGEEERLDPISAEMADSPLTERDGIPGTVLLSFMAGAVVVRRSAFLGVGGYHPRFFIGGEEETVSYPLADAGWQMRYVPDVVMHHHPSVANAPHLRAFGMRNTLWNAWLHRPWRSALRWTVFTLADTPKNRDWARGLMMALGGLPWALAHRRPVERELDEAMSVLDRRRFAARRRLLNRADPLTTRRAAGATGGR
ncbi:glycosyltransferase family 2 protein [Nakamurella deserti]|uniref:glycosyltransferase family 2 protein n=1 Tax=Nakamurella deserti TaxID=2164074 RepID=UPI001478E417|nr:glycosyltransferase [Nakamurella deserti]